MEQKNEENCINCVMKRLRDERITPRAKWRFLFHDYSVFAVSILSLVVGTFSFSVFLNILLSGDWDIYPQIGRGFWEHAFKTFPFLWLVFLCLFVFYALYAFFSSTEKGYRYKQSIVISLSIFLSLILGSLAYFAGIGEKIDDFLIETVPYYHTITGDRACLWLQPNRGLLAGMIVSTGTKPFIIVDFNGNRWIATGTPVISSNITNHPGERVKILGVNRNNFIFEAREFRIWRGSVEQNPCQ